MQLKCPRDDEKEVSKAESLMELMAEGEEALAESSHAKAESAFGRGLRETSACSVMQRSWT